MRRGSWLRSGVRKWTESVPLVPLLRGYRPEDFSHDLIAGLVVGMIAIPQAVAYAYLAGVPPQSGLYACLVPVLLYSVFGSSRDLVVGPVAVAALMVASTVSAYAPKFSDEYLSITTIISLQVGLILLALRVSRMGGLVHLLSHSVISGFVNAAAILIIISQLPAFTGIQPDGDSRPLTVLGGLAEHLSGVGGETISYGALSLILLVLFPRFLPRVSGWFGYRMSPDHALTRVGPVLVAVLAIVAVTLTDSTTSVATVGAVPSGLPNIHAPPFDLELWRSLLPSSAVIAVVAYIESYSIGASLAARKQRRVNSHQELIAIGAANVGAAFTGAYPVAGSFSRSSVNFHSGGRTPVSSLTSGVVILFVLLFLTEIISNLPQAVLASIVIVSVLGLMDFRSGLKHWPVGRDDTLTAHATFLLVLFMGVEVGLLAGVALSIAFFMRASARPRITQVGRLENSESFRSVRRYDVETCPHVLALRIDESIFFANAAQIEDKILKRVQGRQDIRHLLLVCSSVNSVDITGVQMLLRLNANLVRSGVAFSLCDVKGWIKAQLDVLGVTDQLSGKLFFSADQAMKYLSKELRGPGQDAGMMPSVHAGERGRGEVDEQVPRA